MTDILKDIKLLSKHEIKNKRVLLRVDFNVTLSKNLEIVDDIRILKSLPTIKLLLKNKNKIIIVSHLGRPQKRDKKFSLSPVASYLKSIFPNNKVILIDDFLSEKDQEILKNQTEKDIILLENIRFYKQEQENNQEFAKKLATLGNVYINDAFGVSHRKDVSVFGITKYLPSYCGLLLEKEIETVSKIMDHPKKPVVAIIGGAKISTKILFLSKLINIVDFILLGGGLANTLLTAQGVSLGKSLSEKNQTEKAKEILEMAKKQRVKIVLPKDGSGLEEEKEKTYLINQVPDDFSILDIGPETQAEFGKIIDSASTIIWNGPVGFCEDERFKRGTDFIFYSIAQNTNAYSLVGGGDTLAAVSKKDLLDKITHVSTGGGAMLELIENATLPGLEALKDKLDK